MHARTADRYAPSRRGRSRFAGAFGQYCLVLPDLDAVIVITSGVRDMQSVMDLVWQTLLPAMRPGVLPENPAARRRLDARLAHLAVRTPVGLATGALATAVSKRWYQIPENVHGIRAVAVDRDPIAVQLAASTLIRPVRADALRLPFADRSFDVVTAVKFAHHFAGASLRRAPDAGSQRLPEHGRLYSAL